MKKIFINVTWIFALMLLTSALVFSASLESKNKKLVVMFVRVLSQSWDIDSVKELSSELLLSQMQTPNGKFVLRQYQTLGKFEEAEAVTVSGVRDIAEGEKVTVYKFKVFFANGASLVSVAVLEKKASVKVHGVSVKPLYDGE